MTRQPASNRLWIAAVALVVIVAGLASRSGSLPLPAFVASYAGDTLWAVLVFLLLAIAAPRRPAAQLAAAALAIAFAVELLQLYQPAWLEALRDTTVGHLLLGQGFLFSDLLCYTFGITVAALVYHVATARDFDALPTIVGGALLVTVIVSIVACNLGHGGELFGFVGRIPGGDKTGHFLLMGALSFFLVLMVVPRLKLPTGRACALVILAVAAIVTAEEGSQYFLSARTFSTADLLASLAGIVFFGALASLLVVCKD